ncbi:MAG: PaaI family thioesterase [Bdellovibrionota bacterium]
MENQALQDKFAPHNECFGCGPSNAEGLQVKSIVTGEVVKAEWTPQKKYEAFPGVLNGGIVGALLDCHSNWTAAWHLMQKTKVPTPPCTVTASYNIKLLRPTPTDGKVELIASVVESTDDKATIKAELIAGGKTCALCEGVFVAVKPGHPAYHRW